MYLSTILYSKTILRETLLVETYVRNLLCESLWNKRSFQKYKSLWNRVVNKKESKNVNGT